MRLIPILAAAFAALASTSTKATTNHVFATAAIGGSGDAESFWKDFTSAIDVPVVS